VSREEVRGANARKRKREKKESTTRHEKMSKAR
jgi:hypothetical protein